MAISTPANLDTLFDTAAADDSPSTSGSITFTAGRLYVCTAFISRSGTVDCSTGFAFTHGATDRTSSWNYMAHTAYGTSRTMAAYWYVPSVTETVVLTFDFPGTGILATSAVGLSVVEWASGFHPTTPIRQSKVNAAVTTTGVTVTLDAAPITGNQVCAQVGTRAASGALDPRTNWTELFDVQGTGTTDQSGAWQFQYVTDPNLEATASGQPTVVGNRTYGIIAFEIAAAPSAGSAVFGGTGLTMVETDVVGGGKVFTITLTGDTFIPN